MNLRVALGLSLLEGTARYAGSLLAPAESYGLWLRICLPFAQKREPLTMFMLILGHFWCSVVTYVMFSSNLSQFKKK